MEYGVHEMSLGLVKSVFYLVAVVLLAMLLYQLFFGVDDNALRYACNSMETAIANYYYAYCFYPTAHINDGVSSSSPLNVTVYNNTDLYHVDTDNGGSRDWSYQTANW